MNDTSIEIIEPKKPAGAGKRGQGFVLTAGDVDILKLIYDYRLLQRVHLCLLTGRHSNAVHRRLFKLVRAGYLSEPLGGRGLQEKYIYRVGKGAVRLLVERGLVSPEQLRKRIRTHELKPHFLQHEMMITDLHCILTLAMRGTPFRIVSWQAGHILNDYVHFTDLNGEPTRLPIEPDALVTIEDTRLPEGRNRVNYYLEADRSSENHTLFSRKIVGYFHYREQGLHANPKKHNLKGFRVLTMTVSAERAAELRDLARTLIPDKSHKYYFFAPFLQFSLESPHGILGNICLSARGSDSDRAETILDPFLKAPQAV